MFCFVFSITQDLKKKLEDKQVLKKKVNLQKKGKAMIEKKNFIRQ